MILSVAPALIIGFLIVNMATYGTSALLTSSSSATVEEVSESLGMKLNEPRPLKRVDSLYLTKDEIEESQGTFFMRQDVDLSHVSVDLGYSDGKELHIFAVPSVVIASSSDGTIGSMLLVSAPYAHRTFSYEEEDPTRGQHDNTKREVVSKAGRCDIVWRAGAFWCDRRSAEVDLARNEWVKDLGLEYIVRHSMYSIVITNTSDEAYDWVDAPHM